MVPKMIQVYGRGHLRNNPLELQRALEILQAVLYKEPYPHEWSLKYGEIAEAGQRIDAIIELWYEDGTMKKIGVEVESHKEGVDKAIDRLRWLKAIGSLSVGYVYVRSLEEVQKSISVRSKRLIVVR
jgi:hypothetical protein